MSLSDRITRKHDLYNGLNSERISVSSNSSLKQSIIDSGPYSMKSYIENLNSNIRINKNLVQSLLLYKSNESLEDTAVDSVNSPKAFENLFNENKAIEDKIEKVIQEKNDLQTKNLLNEQIFNEWNLRHNETITEYEDKISELQFQDERKEKVLQDLMKFNSLLKLEADIASKSKNLFEIKPNPQILDMHCKIEIAKECLQQRIRELNGLKIRKSNLKSFLAEIKLNFHKIKALLRNPLNRKVNLDKFFIKNQSISSEPKIPSLDLSLIEKKSSYAGVLTMGHGVEVELAVYKKEFHEKSKILMKITEENLIIQKENQELITKNKILQEKIEAMQRKHNRSNLTTEIKQDYENSVCYRLKSLSLDSISEIEVNHSNFYDSYANE
jgi:hypothetical protein